jgi:hypothetical protein
MKMKMIMSNLKRIISAAYAKRSYEKWVYRSAPFKLSYRQLALGKDLSPQRLKLWRKKYLEGRDAGKVLLVHMGLDRLRYAFYKNDLSECFKILGEMRASQEELGIYMTEIDQIEEQILELQKRINSRIRDPDKVGGFAASLRKALGLQSVR